MKNLSLIGRLLFGIPFGFIGLGHFIQNEFFTMEFTTHVNIGPYMMMLTGALLILASISIVVNKYVQLSTFALAILIIIIIATVHIPNYFNGDEMQKAFAMFGLLKDISLLGGAIIANELCNLKMEKEAK